MKIITMYEPKQNVTSQMPEPILLDANQTAALLGIGRTHLYSLHSSGKLPLPIRLGKRTLWCRKELEEWVNAGCPSRIKWLEIINKSGQKITK